MAVPLEVGLARKRVTLVTLGRELLSGTGSGPDSKVVSIKY